MLLHLVGVLNICSRHEFSDLKGFLVFKHQPNWEHNFFAIHDFIILKIRLRVYLF